MGGGGGYGAPPPPGFGPPGGGFPPPGGPALGGDPNYALGKVKTPAIIMLICTCIGIAIQLLSLILNILGTGIGAMEGGSDGVSSIMSGVVGMVFNVIAILIAGFCIFGFVKMMKLQGRGVSFAAVILAMIPCFGACWCLNLPLGIWALVAMNDAQVKASFT
jgi:hypothetical protein